MTILLLGKDGQLGWQLQRSLAPHGNVLAYGRQDCDLTNFDQLRTLIRQANPSAIVNASAYTAVDKAESEPGLAFKINAEAPGLMAEEAARNGALLIHYSTDYIFDGSKKKPYLETDAPAPLSIYGQSKLAGEQAIATANCRSVIFRTSWVFGARGTNFVKTILRLAREKESLNIVADQIGSPTPAALIATVSGVVLGMLRQGQAMEAVEHRLYHLVAANPVSWCGFAKTIVGMASSMPGFNLRLGADAIHPIPSLEYPTPAARPLNSRLDCAQLESDFGLQMPDWQPYLGRMLQLLSLKQNGY